jgi:hypothetical protein
MNKKMLFSLIATLALLTLLVLVILIHPKPVYAVSGEIEAGPPLTDTFTYQGYFEQSGSPANGYYDFSITIWDLETLGTQIASTQVLENIQVQDGLFTFHLVPNVSMNEVFNGAGRWLQVAIRQHGVTTWTTLPRQPVTASPYAWSLRPGAKVEGALDGSILSITNNGQGGAINASSSRVTGVTISATHTTDGYAVLGSTAGGYPAVGGINTGGGNGVYATSSTGIGVYGYTGSQSTGIGIVGVQSDYSIADTGLWKPGGLFGGRNGVIGISKQDGGYGVYGINKSTTGSYSIGIYGESLSPDGWAGYFSSSGNGVRISTPVDKVGLTVINGTKSAEVETDQGGTLLYSEESTEVWFSDYGFGTLDDGVAQINIDPLYAQTVNLDEPYHVFLQAYGDAQIYVTNRTAQSFEVHLSQGDGSVEFSYRIVAKRLGYEDDRLELSPGPSPESIDGWQQTETQGELP